MSLYTDTNSNFEVGFNGKSAIPARGIRANEETQNTDPDGWGVGKLGDVGRELENIQERSGGEDRAWLDQLRQADQSPGGIVSRLLEDKLDRLGEVRGRLEIVNARKAEYERKVAELEREIEEIRNIAQNLRPAPPPTQPE